MATDQIPGRTEQGSPYVVGIDGDDGAGVDIIGIVVGVWHFLSGLFRGRVDQTVKTALEGLRDGVAKVGKAIVDGIAWLSGKLRGVLDAMKRFIGRTFGPLYDVLVNIVQRVQRILDRVLGPVIDFLQMIRKHVWAIYRDIVKPVLDIIEFLRIPLKILASFNVEWAKRLDATLANLEDWIVDNFQYALGKLNQVINTLNDIVDFTGLLKRVTLIRSLMRDFDLVLRLGWNRIHIPLEGDKRARYFSGPDRRSIAEVNAVAREYIERRGGPDRGRINEHVADLILRLGRI